ncbi:hypothetical protein GEOBRER4_n0225 [Citrifermentans bremense]|uniref:Uncharacterized protein n=1 Tax=Citrifermentans bremense TaxID=60035 RepID=A0A7R7FSB1_9BACT|nr:hypothetical protein [Citrifermentans bremense]BCO11139.1 hypothetical protein GEOBRER4_n0225 [Citrifermentans bremense]
MKDNGGRLSLATAISKKTREGQTVPAADSPLVAAVASPRGKNQQYLRDGWLFKMPGDIFAAPARENMPLDNPTLQISNAFAFPPTKRSVSRFFPLLVEHVFPLAKPVFSFVGHVFSFVGHVFFGLAKMTTRSEGYGGEKSSAPAKKQTCFFAGRTCLSEREGCYNRWVDRTGSQGQRFDGSPSHASG